MSIEISCDKNDPLVDHRSVWSFYNSAGDSCGEIAHWDYSGEYEGVCIVCGDKHILEWSGDKKRILCPNITVNNERKHK